MLYDSLVTQQKFPREIPLLVRDTGPLLGGDMCEIIAMELVLHTWVRGDSPLFHLGPIESSSIIIKSPPEEYKSLAPPHEPRMGASSCRSQQVNGAFSRRACGQES